jgi:Dual-action HEIGH metallo-peptidase
MKKMLSLAAIAVTLFSCQKQEAPAVNEPISQDVLAAISKAGFSTEGVIREEGGYIVEGDIFIDDNHLRTQPQWGTHYVVETEQYHTTNLVAAPRVITVSVNSKLPAAYKGTNGYVDLALKRYNAENLSLTFQLVSSGGNIDIVTANGSYLASAGFPTSTGSPYNQVKVNTRSLNGQPENTIVSVLAHEIGHCIGFRHTDYMDRSISCGGSTTNEGASTVGAIWIPNTPQTAAQVRTAISNGDASFMLSCIGGGQNRPFTTSDKTALNYLY